MKTGTIIAGIAAVAAIAFAIYFVDIDMTEEAALPDVDVSVEGGNLPEFEAETGDIDVGSTELSVTVPTVDVESPEEDGRLADNQ